MSKKENEYQQSLIKKLRNIFPGCIILHNDATCIQGIPDLTVLWRDKWAFLECKKESEARKRPNQVYYTKLADKMSFGRFVYPENEEEVLHELQQAFGA